MLRVVAKSRLPTRHGEFSLMAFEDFADGLQHLALVMGDMIGADNPLMRIHSECLTGEVFGSLRCDCDAQLQAAMEKIAGEGCGAILYLRQEGRGIGLHNKLRAYALQDEGMDTVEANIALGFEGDLRDFAPAVQMLDMWGIKLVRLMTNNPDKVTALEKANITVDRVPLVTCVSVENQDYLQTKAEKMGHIIPQNLLSSTHKKSG